jgi:rhodanese-related sulfurtransferase
MNSAAQLGIIAVVSLAAAGGTWLIKGPPPPPAAFKCDPTKIGGNEICLADVKGNVLWVDARLRSEWEENGLAGSILWNMDPKEDQNEMEAGSVMRIAAGVDLVVVYCSSEACGTSKEVAERIRKLGLGIPVKALHGGWVALKGSGKDPLKDSSSGK